MAERTLRLTVTAVADRSLTAVVQPLVDSVRRANTVVTASTRAMSDGMKRAAKDGVDPLGKAFDQAAARAQRAYKQIEDAAAKAAAKEAADADRAAQAKVRAEQRAWDQRLRASKRAREEEERAILRDVAAHERAAERKAAIDKRTAERRAKDIVGTGSNAISNVMGVGRAAAGFAGRVAGGMGVNFDIGSMVGKSVSLQSIATQISNSAFKEGGKREVPADLVQIARVIGDKTASDPSRVLAGLSAYQGKTGDLDTIKAGLADLSKLSKASYTDLNDMIDAAGDVGNALGEVGQSFATPKEKAEAIGRVMRVIAAQGQVGAVEIKDLAVQMAKLSAASTMFEGSGEKNLEMMGALAQFARSKGGAASATQAATSVAGFVNTLKTPARQDAFKAMGIDVYSKTQVGMLKNPFELIMEALDKSAMDPRGFKTMFANVIGAKPAEALATVYRQAEANRKGSGRGEVQKMLTDYMKPMGEDKINADFNAAMSTTESKAQLFQNQLERIADSMATRLLPAMEALAPKMLILAEGASAAVVWISQHLGESIALAITASLAKAAVGDMLKKSLETTIAGLLTKGGGGGVAGGAGGGLAGALGTAALVFTVAMATFEVGKAVINAIAEEGDKGVNKAIDDQVAAANALSEAAAAVRMERAGEAKVEEGKRKGGAEGDAMIAEGERMVAESKTAQLAAKRHLEQAKEQQEGAAQSAKDMDWMLPAQVGASYMEALFSPATALAGGVAGDKSISDLTAGATNKANEGDISASLVHINATLQALSEHMAAAKPKGGPMEVTVTNMPTGSLVGGNGIEGIPPP